MADPPKTQAPSPSHDNELVQRGIYAPSPVGTTLFFLLRAADIPLQHALLSGAWSVPLLSRLGLSTSASALGPAAVATGLFGLSPTGAVLLAMSAGCAAKQAYWLAALSKEQFPVRNALLVSVTTSAANVINSLLFAAAGTSVAAATPKIPIPFTDGVTLPLPVVAGALVFAAGIFVETASEIQRLAFKDDPKNKGVIRREGFWAGARHVNYGGFVLWRTGYALASSGWVYGIATAAVWSWNFVKNSIPELDGYMSGRYGEQWAGYKREVKWLLFPGLI